MTFDSSAPDDYSDATATLAIAFASQAAAAIENARLYSAEQMRLKIAEGMREQVRLLNSNANQNEIYTRVLQQIALALEADSAVIFERDRENLLLQMRQAHGFDARTGANAPLCMALINRALEERQVVVERCDAPLQSGDTVAVERAAQLEQLYREHGYRSLLAIPLISDRELYGGIVLYFKKTAEHSHEQLAMAATVGYQSALGLENTRLREEAARSAIADERYRIARDLHDSVSQALYGISLGARTARQVISHDLPRATDAVDYVLELAEGGLAEMRALILELQPESLQTEGLVVVLHKQLIALCARHKLGLDVKLTDEPNMPTKHKEAIYRILMEAMQNTVKHAKASSVRLSMDCAMDVHGQRTLSVILEDNGKGFDVTRQFRGHMGLGNMRARAEKLGGCFTISSEIGTGTRIQVTMPVSAPGNS
jgi:signal transduction histidine kinase